MKYRLAVFASHPVQYHVPLYRALAQHPKIDLTVFYGYRRGTKPFYDPGFGRQIHWGIDLLEGYRSVFLKNISPLPSPDRFWGLLNPGVLWRVWRRRFDAILVHGYAHATCWIALLAARALGLPFLFRGETVWPPPGSRRFSFKRHILRWFFRQVNFCLAIGSKARAFYRAYDVPEDRIVWSPYSIDLNGFRKAALNAKPQRARMRRQLGLPPELPLILYAGKLIPRKRPGDLVEAVSQLSSPASLVFVGEGVLRQALQRQIARLRLSSARLVGFKNQAELPRYYAMADLFVLPSAYEPWGIAINEAMCAGLPIVSTHQVAAAADLVREGQNGYLYEAGDVGTLSRLLQQLVSDASLRSRLGNRSLSLIPRWSPGAAVAGIVRTLQQLHQRDRGTGGAHGCGS